MEGFVNQLVYFGFFQSLFLLLIFLLSPKVRKNINGYIAFLILLLAIGLTGRIINISEIYGKDFRFIAFSELATLFFGATILLFSRSALLGKKFEYKDLLHFIPGVIYVTAVLFVFILPPNDLFDVRVRADNLYITITIFMGTGLVFNIGYWLMSCRVFYNFHKQLKDELSYSVQSQFFQSFLAAIGLCLLTWLTVYFISIFGDQMAERTARQFIWIGITFIILFIAYHGIRAPELFKINPLIQPKKYAQSKLSKTDLNELKIRLDTLMEEKKPYLNGKLLKAELAEMLGVSNPEMARLLNEQVGMNFFEYVNYFRIKEFVLLARTEKAKNLTFFALAQEAGFNSKTTFNKSFKNLMGSSPKEYLSKEMD